MLPAAALQHAHPTRVGRQALFGQQAPQHTPCCCSAESPGPSQVVKYELGPPLQAPIERIFYLSREGRDSEHEVHPVPNPVVLEELETCDAIVYGMGSLYTSICPSLVLEVRVLQTARDAAAGHVGRSDPVQVGQSTGW